MFKRFDSCTDSTKYDGESVTGPVRRFVAGLTEYVTSTLRSLEYSWVAKEKYESDNGEP